MKKQTIGGIAMYSTQLEDMTGTIAYRVQQKTTTKILLASIVATILVLFINHQVIAFAGV